MKFSKKILFLKEKENFLYEVSHQTDSFLLLKNTQNFVTIPYYKLILQIEYKSEEQGITVIKQEESHSSKCSFLDNETIEHHKKYRGRRMTRGLFISQKGIIINADVNGAYNILKKAFLNAVDADRIEAVGLHPTRWRLNAVTS